MVDVRDDRRHRLQFAQVAVFARILPTADFGLMAMISVVLAFGIAYADMGLSNAVIYRQDTTRDQLSSLYWLNVLAGLGVFVAVVALFPRYRLVLSRTSARSSPAFSRTRVRHHPLSAAIRDAPAEASAVPLAPGLTEAPFFGWITIRRKGVMTHGETVEVPARPA